MERQQRGCEGRREGEKTLRSCEIGLVALVFPLEHGPDYLRQGFLDEEHCLVFICFSSLW